MASEKVNDRRESFVLKKPKVLVRGVYTQEEEEKSKRKHCNGVVQTKRNKMKQKYFYKVIQCWKKKDEELDLLPRLEEQFSYDSIQIMLKRTYLILQRKN